MEKNPVLRQGPGEACCEGRSSWDQVDTLCILSHLLVLEWEVLPPLPGLHVGLEVSVATADPFVHGEYESLPGRRSSVARQP